MLGEGIAVKQEHPALVLEVDCDHTFVFQSRDDSDSWFFHDFHSFNISLNSTGVAVVIKSLIWLIYIQICLWEKKKAIIP